MNGSLRDPETAQQKLGHKSHERQVKGADRGQPRQDIVQILSRGRSRANARNKPAVLAQVVRHFVRIENDRDVKEREKDDQRKKNNS